MRVKKRKRKRMGMRPKARKRRVIERDRVIRVDKREK